MRIFDEENSLLDAYDETKGYLKPDTLFICRHEAVEAIAEQGHWETVTEYPNGGKDVVWIVDVPGVEDRKVFVGIRPEGFEVDPNGALTCALSNLEVMGRDVSVVSTHSASLNPVIRSIVDADTQIDGEAETVQFSLKPHKVFLFDAETEERIYF